MTNSHEETDSGIPPTSSPECSLSFSASDATVGSEQDTSFARHGKSDPLRQVREAISQIKDTQVAEQAQRLLSTMERIVQLVPPEKLVPRCVPPLQANQADDGSLSVDWIFPDFRVGFNIEPNPEDSGWHLVSSKRLGEMTASGHLSNMSEIVALLVDFILSNV